MSTSTRDGEPGSALLLATLEQLLSIGATSISDALDQAAQLVADALGADKVDAFLYAADIDTLVALGTSNTPMGHKQQALGLDRLPLSNGGSTVRCYRSGTTVHSGRLDLEPDEPPGLVQALGVRSIVNAPLRVADELRGVLAVSSARENFFTAGDITFLEAVARWVGMVTHRAELIERVTGDAAERGRRGAAQELITVVAHDLRNFVTPIKMRVDLLRRKARAAGREDDVDDLSEVSNGLARLGTLISDLLDVERMEGDIYSGELAPLDLADLARATVTVMAVNEVQIHVDAPQPVVVQADASRLRQVLENLLSNATRYAPAETPVTVSVTLGRRDDRLWGIVTVADHGRGIDPEIMPRLFERFSRGAASSGLGIGLYVARRVVEAHGGMLTAESVPGQGATFRLAIPCGVEAVSAAGSTAR